MTEPVPSNLTFISHAHEDKGYVKNLVDTLLRYEVAVWYDDYEIEIGDSIYDSLNRGLRAASFGVVVLSHNFFAKKWPKRELAALAGLLETGKILPVFHELTASDVAAYDPLLAGIKGLSSEGNVRVVAAPIAKKVLGASLLPGSSGSGTASKRKVYTRETIKLSWMPLSEQQHLEHIVFDECVIQGINVLTDRGGVDFIDCWATSWDILLPVKPGRPIVGSIGIENITFRGCRFKDVGFTVLTEQLLAYRSGIQLAPPEWDALPPWLR